MNRLNTYVSTRISVLLPGSVPNTGRATLAPTIKITSLCQKISLLTTEETSGMSSCTKPQMCIPGPFT